MGTFANYNNRHNNLFSYINKDQEVKDIKFRYGEKWSEITTDNQTLNSIFQSVDNGDGIIQAEEISTLNKVLNYIDSLVKKTKNNGVLEEKEINKFQKMLDKGKVDISSIPEPKKPSGGNWSEGLDRNISAIKISNLSTKLIPPELKDELRAIAQEQGFEVQEVESGEDPWIEDSSIRRADGQEYVQYYIGKFRLDEQYDKIDGRAIATGQGRVSEKASTFDLDINNKDKYYGASYLEGGNVLNTNLADGTPAAVIGEDSIAYSLSALKLDNTPENVELVKEKIAQDLGIDIKNITFIPQYDFHIDMLYRPLHNGEFAVPDYEEAIKVLNETSIPELEFNYDDVKTQFKEVSTSMTELLGKEFVSERRLRNWTQNQPKSESFIKLKVKEFLNMYNEAPEIFQDIASEDSIKLFTQFVNCPVEQSSDATTPKAALTSQLDKLNTESKEAREFAESELVKSGYKLVKLPTFTGKTNFMNGVGGTSSKTGETFYITNKSEIPSLQDIITGYLKKAGIDKVYFVSTTETLGYQGGIDCLTKEE